jgi:hypothetical protein
MRPTQSKTTPGSLVIVLALLVAVLAAGCSQEQGPTEPDGDVTTPLLTHKNGEHGKPGGNTSPGSEPETFLVSVATDGERHEWTPAPQVMQNASKKSWLHVFDSGGNGTRGFPDFPNAAFNSGTHMQASAVEGCELEGLESHRGLLYSKFHQTTSALRVFDFQVSFDIADNPMGFSIFLFRWKEGDRIFSARTGFGFRGSDPAPAIDFLGDDKDIRDSTIDRTFRISGAKVIASEHDGKKVIAALSCDNLGEYDVTVHGTS